MDYTFPEKFSVSWKKLQHVQLEITDTVPQKTDHRKKHRAGETQVSHCKEEIQKLSIIKSQWKNHSED